MENTQTNFLTDGLVYDIFNVPEQEVPMQFSSSVLSPEHSIVLQVRVRDFFPFFNAHALHGAHSPYPLQIEIINIINHIGQQC